MERPEDDGPAREPARHEPTTSPETADPSRTASDRAPATPPASPAAALRAALAHAAPRLRDMDDESTARRPAPGRWSPREVLGHLVDSATNNHGRFVRAQLADPLVFDGYDQDAWVRVQRHAEAPWSDLVDTFLSLNGHIARTMEAAPAHERLRLRSVHALDRLAWRTVPREQATTLQYFMEDYVGHLAHHLAQIEPALVPDAAGPDGPRPEGGP